MSNTRLNTLARSASIFRKALGRGAQSNRAAAAVAMLLAAATAAAQTGGTVNFGNHSSSLVTNALTSLPVAGADNVRAALYWAPLGSGTFAQLGSTVTVGVPLPGLFVGGTRTNGPATPGGTSGAFRVRAWGGGYATYEDALGHAGVLIGQSAVITNLTGNPWGSPPSPPVSLIAGGFSGFTLTPNTGLANPPIITCSTNKTVPCGGPWTFDTPTAVDGCTSNALPVYVLSTITAGQCPQTITRTWAATNSCNTNYATCSQTVTVVNTMPPVMSCASDKSVTCGTAWTFDAPTAADACSGSNLTVIATATLTNGVCPQIMTRFWSATDACGNSNSCSQAVTVMNTAPPVIACASNKTVDCSTDWTFDNPQAFDSCTGASVPVWVVGTVSTSLGPCVQVLTRTWAATNACNTNLATCSQAVTATCSNCLMIAVAKACPPYPVPPGGMLAFTGTVTNTGNVTLTNVVVVNDQPAPNTLVFGPATLAAGEGAQFSASYRVPPGNLGPFVDTLAATGASIYGGVASNYFTATCPGTNVYAVAGDLNGDGIVDQNELNAVLANYWTSSQWVYMTNPASLGGGIFQFALTNATAWNFTVLVSSNMVDWTTLPGPAYPVYQFYDGQAASNAPMRFYRLRWP